MVLGANRGLVHQILWWTVFVLLTLILTTHFMIVQLSNLPSTPAKYELQGAIRSYVEPYFAQNWAFFAPSPSDRSLYLIVAGEFRGPSGTHKQTPWINVSAPLYDAVRHNRLGAITAMELMVANALQSYNNAIASDPRALDPGKSQRYFKPLISSRIDPLDFAVCSRIGAAVLLSAYPGVRFSRLHVVIGIHVFPRYSQKSRPDDRSLTYVSVEPIPFPDVVPFVPPAV